MDTRRRFDELDGWRGIAALLVLLYHAYSAIGRPWPGTFAGALAMAGPTAVAWFFALSGFVIYRPFAVAALAGGPGPAAGPFLLRRAARLVPLYYTVLAAVWLVPILGPPTDFSDLALHAAFLHTYRPRTFYGLLLPAWSLGVEALFYVALAAAGPALCALARRAGPHARRRLVYGLPLACGGVGLAAQFVLARTGVAADALPWRQNLATFAPCFGCGLLVAALSADGVRVGPRAALALRLLGLGLLASALRPALLRVVDVLPLWPWAAGFALVIASTVLAPRTGPWLRAMSARPFALLGAWSYGIYLWHAPLLHAASSLGLLPARPGGFALAVVVLATTTIGLSATTFRYVERPALRVGRGAASAPALAPAIPHAGVSGTSR